MLYPLKFHPILHEKIWGGNKLKTILNKPTSKNNVGESWEITTVNNNISVVSNGDYRGENLTELIKKYKGDLLGAKVYKEFGNQFPLLIKFIDAKEDLSVQLHPNDQLAKTRHNSFGKTEMWYVVQADIEAQLIVGFNKNTSRKEYNSYLENGKITHLLNFENISKGDSYFINSGKIHAIGAGALIAEIQQTSDVTYRVYDWDRKDDNGNARELHTDLALDALDYEVKEDFKINYKELPNQSTNLASCEYFTTNVIKVTEKVTRDLNKIDSFKIYMCVEGNGKIKIGEDSFEEINGGETVLIPAISKTVELIGDNMKVLEIYIK